MRNADRWLPTKFVKHGTGWRASRDPAQVGIGSRLMTDILARRYASAIDRHARGDLLDHGCGQAPLFGIYGPKASSVTCIDWGSSVHDTGHADVLCDLNHPAPLEASSFDTIISSDVIEHLWNPATVFGEFRRLLRPGGVAIVGTPFYYWVHEAPHDYFRWTRYAFAKFAEEAGLEVIAIEGFGGPREVIADVLVKSVGRRSGRAAALVDRTVRALRLVNVDGQASDLFPLGHIAILRRPA